MSDTENSGSDLSLSCGSSSFEGDDDLDSDDGAVGAHGNDILPVPYQFEPYNTSSDDDVVPAPPPVPAVAPDENRMTDNSWCQCGNCQLMTTARECLCCSEIAKVTTVRDEHPDSQCILDHPGFHPVCLDIHVLRVAYYQYRQQFGERPEQNNERHRYTAYRQFVRWIWQFLGREVRVVIPSCVVCRIRAAFPDAAQNYTGFQELED